MHNRGNKTGLLFVVSIVFVIAIILCNSTMSYAACCGFFNNNDNRYTNAIALRKVKYLLTVTGLNNKGPFKAEGEYYVYEKGEIKKSYVLEAPLIIKGDLTFSPNKAINITAESITIDADISISKKTKEQKPKECKLISKNDITIGKEGKLDLVDGITLEAGADFISKSEKAGRPKNGKIYVNGNLNLNEFWRSKNEKEEEANKNVIYIKGTQNHTINIKNKPKIKNLIIYEDALINTKVKGGGIFWELFVSKENKNNKYKNAIENFGVKMTNPVGEVDYKEDIEITGVISNNILPKNYEYFIKSYLYNEIYLNENIGINLFEKYCNVSTIPTNVDLINEGDGKEFFFLGSDGKNHKIKIESLQYTGISVNNKSKQTKRQGIGLITFSGENNQKYILMFGTTFPDTKEGIDDFLASMRKGASAVIKEQAREIFMSQIISDLMKISDINAFDFEPGVVISNNVNAYEFLSDFSDQAKKWAELEDGFGTDDDNNTSISGQHEPRDAANYVDSESASSASESSERGNTESSSVQEASDSSANSDEIDQDSPQSEEYEYYTQDTEKRSEKPSNNGYKSFLEKYEGNAEEAYYRPAGEKGNRTEMHYFYIIDLNQDGTDDLITDEYVNIRHDIIRFYTLDNDNNVVPLKFENGEDALFDNNHEAIGNCFFYICSEGHIHNDYWGGEFSGGEYTIYVTEGNTIVTYLNCVDRSIVNGEVTYTMKGLEISREEYESLTSNCNDIHISWNLNDAEERNNIGNY